MKINNFKDYFINENKKYKPKNKTELEKLCNDLSVNLGDIDTSLIKDMSGLFYNYDVNKRSNDSFKGIETWDVSNVTDMRDMFRSCPNFNQPLNSWKVDKVRFTTGMFMFCKNFNQPLDKWNVSNVEDMSEMFLGCSSFNQKLNSWGLKKLSGASEVFEGCPIKDEYKPSFKYNNH